MVVVLLAVVFTGDIAGMLNSSANGWSRGSGGGNCGVSKFYLLYLFPFCLNNLLTFIGIFTRNSFISLSRPQSSPRPTLLCWGDRVGRGLSFRQVPDRCIVIRVPPSRSTLFLLAISTPVLDTRMRHSTDLPRFVRVRHGTGRPATADCGSSILRLHHLYKNRIELG